MSEDELKRVDHLFLLVGKNPLPNAVAGQLLCTKGGTVSLLYSAEVANVKEKLKKHLENFGFKVEPELINESDPKDIWRGVRKRMECHASDKAIGLNYTGGTKAMAVHAYRALEKITGEKSLKPACSYLDARSLQMIFDPDDPESGDNSKKLRVKEMVKLNIDTIINLHGWTYKPGSPNRTPKLSKTAAELAKLYAANKESEWIIWKNDLSDKVENHKVMLFNLPTDIKLKNVMDTLRAELNLSGNSLNLNDANVLKIFGTAKAFKRWIHGNWIEHHILAILQGLKAPLNLSDCAQNVETNSVQFDIDVIAIQGYQLFAFSCGLISKLEYKEAEIKAGLKRKLFEAHLRAEQVGGDESCVSLVCLHNNPGVIESEMKQHGLRDRHVKVFGRNHFADLKGGIENWIKTQS